MDQQGFFVGIDLGGTNIKCGFMTPSGEISAEAKIFTESSGGVNHVLDRMADLVTQTQKKLGDKTRIMGVGIGVAGQVDFKNSVLREVPNLQGWQNVHVGLELGKRLGVSVTVDNDANAAALAEFTFGAGKGITEMLMVTLGTGVGGGLILGGTLYRGAGGGAGEFGHIILQKDGPVCSCGRRGCLEAFVGKYAILRRVQEKIKSGRKSLLIQVEPDNLTPEDVSQAALQNDEVAREVLREVGEYLGIGLGNVANLLNLERAVVGGGVANAGELILKSARESFANVALAVSRETMDVVPAQLGERAGMIGAAQLSLLNSKS